jgi:limonene 1,2-monooxygenase
MRFGYFMAPFHPAGQNPTLALDRDLALIEHLDAVGFDEVWIRLGTGVISLPYHNPFMVAHRIAQLDHMTRGRIMFGCGPGQLASDAHMLGIPTDELRPRMQEALGVAIRLLRGETVSHQSWFTLNEARLHLLPYSGDALWELADTGTASSNGARAAGTFGIGLLSMAATTPTGFAALRGHWDAYAERALANQHVPDRAKWRCVGPVHIAPTREQARAEVAYGIVPFANYFNHVAPGGILPGDTVAEVLASNDERRVAIIGTPEDAIARLQELAEQSGGFGTFVLMGHEWADPEATQRSLRLFAQYVAPAFTGRADAQLRSWEWVDGRADHFAGKTRLPSQKPCSPRRKQKRSADANDRHLVRRHGGDVDASLGAGITDPGRRHER